MCVESRKTVPTPHPQGRNRHTDAENGLEDTGGDVEGLSEQQGRTPSCVNSQGEALGSTGLTSAL